MADLDNIVEVVITRENRSVTQKGFGTPLLVGTKVVSNRVATYMSMDDVAAEYEDTDTEYLMAQATFGGTLKPKQIKIGYQDLNSVSATAGVATGDIADLATWQGISDGSITVTVDGGTAQDVTGLDFSAITDLSEVSGIIQAGVTGCTVLNDTTNITFESDTTGSGSSVVLTAGSGGTDLLTVITNVISTDGTDAVTPESLTDALDAIELEDSDWYAVAMYSADSTLITELSSWIGTKEKLAFARTLEAGVLDPSASDDIASELLALNAERVCLSYHTNATTEFIDCALMGQLLPYDVGTITWAFQEIKGIPSDTVLTDTKIQTSLNKRANVFVTYAGRNITRDGMTSMAGTFVDIMRTVDFMKARIQENIYSALVSSLKIPYNQAGFGIVAGEVERVLKGLEDDAVINADWGVYTPDDEDIDPVDKANRHFSGIEFEATLSAAIHTVKIVGFVK